MRLRLARCYSRCAFGTVAALLAALSMSSIAPAATLNQVDDFQGGTTAGWTNGAAATDPTNVASGGPAGTGDRFLLASSSGGGSAGGRMVVFNRSQWLGSYAGIGAISMDLKNLDNVAPLDPLSVRIAFKESTLIGSGGYVSTNAFALPADGQWHHAIFQLNGSAMVPVGTTTLTLAQLLGNPAEMRILSSTAPALAGDAIASKLGIDNIRAIPEPSSFVLALLGLVAIAWRLGRRRRLFSKAPF
jgi:hypothetical protein